MQHKIHIASILVPLAGGEDASLDIPESVMVRDDVVDVVVSRYNQDQVEIIFYEQYALVDMDELVETPAHCGCEPGRASCTIVSTPDVEDPGYGVETLGDGV